MVTLNHQISAQAGGTQQFETQNAEFKMQDCGIPPGRIEVHPRSGYLYFALCVSSASFLGIDNRDKLCYILFVKSCDEDMRSR